MQKAPWNTYFCRYWFFAGLKKYVTYIFSYTTAAKEIVWKVEGKLEKCDHVEEQPISKPRGNLTWWEWLFGAKASPERTPDSSLNRENLWEVVDESFDGCELNFLSCNNEKLKSESGQEYLTAVLGPKDISFLEYIKNGSSRQQQKISSTFSGTY